MPRLHHAIADLAACIDGIAQATGDEHAKQQLTEGIGRLLSGCAHVSAATAALSAPGTEPDTEPVITAQAARLSAADFPAAMTAAVLQAATKPAAQALRPGRRDPARACTRGPPAAGQLPAQVREEVDRARGKPRSRPPTRSTQYK